MNAKTIHIYLGDLEDGTVLALHSGKPVQDVGAGAAVGEEPRSDRLPVTPEEEILARAEYWGDAASVRGAYDGLLRLGLTPKAPISRSGGMPALYLHWKAEGQLGTVCYMNSAAISFEKEDQPHEALRAMPGARVGGTHVTRFSIDTPQGVKRALAAVRAVI
jgi:hypothetical protein